MTPSGPTQVSRILRTLTPRIPPQRVDALRDQVAKHIELDDLTSVIEFDSLTDAELPKAAPSFQVNEIDKNTGQVVVTVNEMTFPCPRNLIPFDAREGDVVTGYPQPFLDEVKLIYRELQDSIWTLEQLSKGAQPTKEKISNMLTYSLTEKLTRHFGSSRTMKLEP